MTQIAFKETASRIVQEIVSTLQDLPVEGIGELVDELAKPRQIFCVGAGRSGIVLSAFCMRMNHLGLSAYLAGGLPCPPAGKGDLIVASSGSGSSASVLSILRKARQAGALVALFTASKAQASELEADILIRISAPSELINRSSRNALQPMRSLFEQTVFLSCETIVCLLKDKLGESDNVMAGRHANLE